MRERERERAREGEREGEGEGAGEGEGEGEASSRRRVKWGGRVLGGDPVACSPRVEQLAALRGL